MNPTPIAVRTARVGFSQNPMLALVAEGLSRPRAFAVGRFGPAAQFLRLALGCRSVIRQPSPRRRREIVGRPRRRGFRRNSSFCVSFGGSVFSGMGFVWHGVFFSYD